MTAIWIVPLCLIGYLFMGYFTAGVVVVTKVKQHGRARAMYRLENDPIHVLAGILWPAALLGLGGLWLFHLLIVKPGKYVVEIAARYGERLS